jgi:NADPH-dependent glutamate synthase beta subunit-like oxidoreductase
MGLYNNKIITYNLNKMKEKEKIRCIISNKILNNRNAVSIDNIENYILKQGWEIIKNEEKLKKEGEFTNEEKNIFLERA